MKAVEGEEIGQLWVYKALRNDAGQVVVDSKGMPILSDELQATGKTTMNKWTGGFSTNLRYKSLTLSAAFDVHYGGWMYSRTKNLMKFTGNGIMTAYNDRNDFVIPNSVQNIGTDENPVYVENNVVVDCYGNRTSSKSIYGYSIQDWIDNGDNWGGETNLVSKTYLKLRQVSVSYDLPHKWIAPLSLQNVRVSFVGSNLITWVPSSNKYIDPDVATYGTGLLGSFGEDYANPTCRKFGFNIEATLGGKGKKAAAATVVKTVVDNSALDALNEQIAALRAENEALKNRKPEKEIVTVDNSRVVTFPYLVNFTVNTTDVVNREKVNLETVAQMIKATPEKKYSVIGYADKQTGTVEGNAKLASSRAQNVYDILINQYGVPASQLVKDSKGGVDYMYMNDEQLSRSVIISEVK